MDTACEVMSRLGLKLHEQKSRVVSVAEERFDFLGYTFGRFYGRNGKPYIGTAPSKKSVSRAIGKIADETSRRWLGDPPSKRIEELNCILRGWCGYFDQAPAHPAHMIVKNCRAASCSCRRISSSSSCLLPCWPCSWASCCTSSATRLYSRVSSRFCRVIVCCRSCTSWICLASSTADRY